MAAKTQEKLSFLQNDDCAKKMVLTSKMRNNRPEMGNMQSCCQNTKDAIGFTMVGAMVPESHFWRKKVEFFPISCFGHKMRKNTVRRKSRFWPQNSKRPKKGARINVFPYEYQHFWKVLFCENQFQKMQKVFSENAIFT